MSVIVTRDLLYIVDTVTSVYPAVTGYHSFVSGGPAETCYSPCVTGCGTAIACCSPTVQLATTVVTGYNQLRKGHNLIWQINLQQNIELVLFTTRLHNHGVQRSDGWLVPRLVLYRLLRSQSFVRSLS